MNIYKKLIKIYNTEKDADGWFCKKLSKVRLSKTKDDDQIYTR